MNLCEEKSGRMLIMPYPASLTSSDNFYVEYVHTGVRTHGLTRRRTSAVSGVISEGFMTIVQPTASAGATFHALNLANETGPELSGIIWHTTFE